MPEDLTEDQIEIISDEIAATAQARHPHSSPEDRERFVRLYLAQLAQEAEPPGRITGAALADRLGLAPQRLSEIQSSALARALRAITTRYPELL